MRSGLFWYGFSLLLCIVDARTRSGGLRPEQAQEEFQEQGTIDKIADSADRLGRMFEYLIIANVHATNTLSKFKWALKFIPQVSATFSAIGFMLKVGMVMTGDGQSPLMKKLTESFDKVNNKLDTITSDLKDTRNLIKIATQRAAYIDAENKILSAHEATRKYFAEITGLQCSDAANCKQQRQLIGTNYVKRLNVEKEIDMILRGTSSDGVFSYSLLDLTKENWKCDVKRIRITGSFMAGLATKGQLAVMLYESITNQSPDMVALETEFKRKLLVLERKKNMLVKKCYDNIDRYIISDVRRLNKIHFSKNNAETGNKMLSEFLLQKYFWIRSYVITISSTCQIFPPVLWTKVPLINDLAQEYRNVFSYVLIGSYKDEEQRSNSSNNDLRLAVIEKTKQEIADVKKKTLYVLWSDVEGGTPHKHTADFKAVLFLKHCHTSFASYATKGGAIQVRNAKEAYPLVYAAGEIGPYGLGLLSTTADNIVQCSLECSSHGSCEFLPHTKQMYCSCNDGFYGNNCGSSIKNLKITNDFDKILQATTLHIPTNTDLKFELEQTQRSLTQLYRTSKERIKLLSTQVGRITTHVLNELNNRKQFQNLVIQYAEIIQDLNYYYHVVMEFNRTTTESDSFLRKEMISFAQYIANPDKLEKLLEMVNYLFVGRYDTQLLNHKSLLFEEMEKNKAHVCSERYKLALDHAYDLLMSLQMQGYIILDIVFGLLNIDVSVAAKYKQTLTNQKNYLTNHTCNIDIPHSTKLEDCRRGYYIYSGMEVDVVCKDSFYLKGLCWLDIIDTSQNC